MITRKMGMDMDGSVNRLSRGITTLSASSLPELSVKFSPPLKIAS
ncbi:hypothetical protein SFC43_18380 [Bacteroides sp. CR5/BHMF/2]|nr:hypothetical protein [Bacteroides sp. CR5/BHMF/2]